MHHCLPHAGLQCRSSTFHALGHRAKLLADELPSCRGRLVMLLEGGYDLKALGESVANTFLGEKVLGAEWQARTVSLHRQYGCGRPWCCRTSDAPG